MLPAMLASWAFGLWLATLGGAWTQGWLHAKLALVVLLSSLHGFFAREARNPAQGGTPRSTRFYRIINELPTVILVLVVFLVVLKPF
jgi:protoporphyrinogen IX oxidase